MRIFKLFIIFCIYSSCSPYNVPPAIQRDFFCYEGTQLSDSIIKFTGYFIKPGVGNLFFLSDGIFVMSSWYSDKSPCDNYKNTANQEKYPQNNINAFYFGIYKIDGKIIKAQWLNPSTADTYYAFEDWYEVIDKSTIRLIYSKNIGVLNGDKSHEKYYKNEKPFTFVSACDTLLVSKTWLKSKKWFWCDERKYFQWKKEQ